MNRFYLLILLLFVFSCGGGGGGGSSPAPTSNNSNIEPPPDDPIDDSEDNFEEDWTVTQAEADVFRTDEYNMQGWAYDMINLAEAYALLEKNNKTMGGEGLAVAVIDTGVYSDHPDIIDNLDLETSFNFITSTREGDATEDYIDHGTNSAILIAGVKNDSSFHGIAYKSEIMNAKIFEEDGNGLISSSQIQYAIRGASGGHPYQIEDGTSPWNTNVKVINSSFSYGGNDGYSEYNGGNDGANSFDSGVISALKDFVKENDVLFIASTGNYKADSASEYQNYPKPAKPALFANNPDLAGYVLAVGAVDRDEDSTYFSNICGVTKNYCLVAPGQNLYGMRKLSNDSYSTQLISGTSFSAPLVSGAAALIRGAWPFLTAPQTAEILLTTATDLGEEGVDDIYGHGLLNIQGAVQSYGEDNVAAGESVESTGINASASNLASDPIFGDAFVNNISPQLSPAIFFDDFGRDYNANLDQRISLRQTNRAINFNLENILLSQYETQNKPFSFSLNNNLTTNFNIRYRKKSDNYFNNISRDLVEEYIQNESSKGFSFNQEISLNSSVGFSFNIDEISNQNNNILRQFNSLTLNSLNENPFQNFFTQNSATNSNSFEQKAFNQFFINHKLFSQKLNFTFLNQNSYLSNNFNFSNITNNQNLQNRVNDFNISYNPKKSGKLSLSFGELQEFDNNILNSKSLGVFSSSEDVKTSYLKLSLSHKIAQNNFLIANISEGQTKINGNQNGIFRAFSDIRSRSLAFGLLQKDFFGGNFGIVYNEPMRVYQGQVTIDIPVARDYDGNVIRSRFNASLKPEGKEQNIELFFAKNLSISDYISFNFLAIRDALNVERKNLDYVGFMSYKKQF